MRMTPQEWAQFTQSHAIDRINLRPCSICGYKLGFITPAITMFERGILFDQGCDCSSGGMVVRTSNWDELAQAMEHFDGVDDVVLLKLIYSGECLGILDWGRPEALQRPPGEAPEAVREANVALSKTGEGPRNDPATEPS